MAQKQCFNFRMLCITVIFSGSLILNLFVVCNMYIRQNKGESWTRKAVEEAELVDSTKCSGHGRAFLDGSFEEERPVCECNACFTGPDCSQLIPGCLVDADSGDPTFLEPFWRNNAADSTILVSGWHRMSYEFSDGSLMSEQLQIHIRKLHAVVGNAVTENKFIIFGGGATQLLHAAVHALSKDGSPSPAAVVASAPYYPVYREQTELFKTEDYMFVGDSIIWKEKALLTGSNIIELITSPNNPDGKLRNSSVSNQGSLAKRVYDLAYYWPHFTAIPSPADEDIMIFTLSKLTGHAGSRFGWAIIKDKDVYERMMTYMSLSTYGVPRETQLRVLKLLKTVLKGEAKELFGYGHGIMMERWNKLSHVLSSSTRLSLQELEPQHCSYSHKIRAPSPAFAWIKCERKEDENCNEVLKTVNVTGRDGSLFGDTSRHVRLSLVKSDDDFHLLLQRMKMLVAAENPVSSPYYEQNHHQLRITTSESNASCFFDSNLSQICGLPSSLVSNLKEREYIGDLEVLVTSTKQETELQMEGPS